MPLTKKGEKIKEAMEDQYGKKKGEQVFYASANKGTIEGVHDKSMSQTEQETLGDEYARMADCRKKK